MIMIPDFLPAYAPSLRLCDGPNCGQHIIKKIIDMPLIDKLGWGVIAAVAGVIFYHCAPVLINSYFSTPEPAERPPQQPRPEPAERPPQQPRPDPVSPPMSFFHAILPGYDVERFPFITNALSTELIRSFPFCKLFAFMIRALLRKSDRERLTLLERQLICGMDGFLSRPKVQEIFARVLSHRKSPQEAAKRAAFEEIASDLYENRNTMSNKAFVSIGRAYNPRMRSSQDVKNLQGAIGKQIFAQMVRRAGESLREELDKCDAWTSELGGVFGDSELSEADINYLYENRDRLATGVLHKLYTSYEKVELTPEQVRDASKELFKEMLKPVVAQVACDVDGLQEALEPYQAPIEMILDEEALDEELIAEFIQYLATSNTSPSIIEAFIISLALKQDLIIDTSSHVFTLETVCAEVGFNLEDYSDQCIKQVVIKKSGPRYEPHELSEALQARIIAQRPASGTDSAEMDVSSEGSTSDSDSSGSSSPRRELNRNDPFVSQLDEIGMDAHEIASMWQMHRELLTMVNELKDALERGGLTKDQLLARLDDVQRLFWDMPGLSEPLSKLAALATIAKEVLSGESALKARFMQRFEAALENLGDAKRILDYFTPIATEDDDSCGLHALMGVQVENGAASDGTEVISKKTGEIIQGPVLVHPEGAWSARNEMMDLLRPCLASAVEAYQYPALSVTDMKRIRDLYLTDLKNWLLECEFGNAQASRVFGMTESVAFQAAKYRSDQAEHIEYHTVRRRSIASLFYTHREQLPDFIWDLLSGDADTQAFKAMMEVDFEAFENAFNAVKDQILEHSDINEHEQLRQISAMVSSIKAEMQTCDLQENESFIQFAFNPSVVDKYLRFCIGHVDVRLTTDQLKMAALLLNKHLVLVENGGYGYISIHEEGIENTDPCLIYLACGHYERAKLSDTFMLEHGKLNDEDSE